MKAVSMCLAFLMVLGSVQYSQGSPRAACTSVIVNCFVDPCMFAQCSVAGAVCRSNYCGGCNAEWYVGSTNVSGCCNAVA
ncbi:uncharacterized protein LOC131929914 [Physella acuta]|uniref:uncharacterized protein LOC131929914 n=1 Tax=Physella acuta TaxID=109671 RepID=UPI0027DDC3E5|nr:uncharacterized protein LOC131929914 [Physella acuta]